MMDLNSLLGMLGGSKMGNNMSSMSGMGGMGSGLGLDSLLSMFSGGNNGSNKEMGSDSGQSSMDINALLKVLLGGGMLGMPNISGTSNIFGQSSMPRMPKQLSQKSSMGVHSL